VARGRNRALKTSAFYKKMSLFDYDYLDPSTYENFEELLEGQKVDPNECDENGMTPLHHIASQLFEMSSVVNTDFYVIKILLRYNANPNIQDRWGRTPIMCFEPENVKYSNVYPVFDILRDVTDLTLVDNDGETFDQKYWQIKEEN
jgi:Ankyrin repeat